MELMRTKLIVAALIIRAVMVTIPAQAATDEYSPPELLFGVKVGDRAEKVLAQNGWYDCGRSNSKDRLCFDRVTTLGETGRYAVDFINGKALAGELVIRDVSAMSRMMDRLPNWRAGNQTLVSIETKNTSIDVVKAVHDLGGKEAMRRFSRYLAGNGRHLLTEIVFVPRSPPFEQQYSSAREYLDGLSAEGVFLSLTTLGSPLNVTVLKIHPSLAAKKNMFPEFCDAKCEHWAVPASSEIRPTLWGRIIEFIK